MAVWAIFPAHFASPVLSWKVPYSINYSILKQHRVSLFRAIANMSVQ